MKRLKIYFINGKKVEIIWNCAAGAQNISQFDKIWNNLYCASIVHKKDLDLIFYEKIINYDGRDQKIIQLYYGRIFRKKKNEKTHQQQYHDNNHSTNNNKTRLKDDINISTILYCASNAHYIIFINGKN